MYLAHVPLHNSSIKTRPADLRTGLHLRSAATEVKIDTELCDATDSYKASLGCNFPRSIHSPGLRPPCALHVGVS